jgi:hypothetical protein
MNEDYENPTVIPIIECPRCRNGHLSGGSSRRIKIKNKWYDVSKRDSDTLNCLSGQVAVNKISKNNTIFNLSMMILGKIKIVLDEEYCPECKNVLEGTHPKNFSKIKETI